MQVASFLLLLIQAPPQVVHSLAMRSKDRLAFPVPALSLGLKHQHLSAQHCNLHRNRDVLRWCRSCR